ncbi:DUF982 domain-containing protein [Mesorhizobium tamadayense]|uniref:DUF982 domain-containing protein n=1 Tax=Mesorhizobium tamadayense TaxID=425306 RepID=A0A3P3G8I0_9HYPH|nr:DUF982 domain-containing protein [Mesorhizobium tamadayense]RRI06389.1 DUF982 domain-containing protein [Mesorhizobium tamadayense]
MALHWFDPPVYVKTDQVGMRYGVNHVEGAAEQLLKWPRRGGEKWQAAVELCIAAMEGKTPPKEVRAAFEAAAEEAGMLLPNN